MGEGTSNFQIQMMPKKLKTLSQDYTPGSINSLLSDLFKEFGRGMLGGVRDYVGEVLGGF